MYVCMYVCINIYVYRLIDFLSTIEVSICLSIYISISITICVCIYVSMYFCICICVDTACYVLPSIKCLPNAEDLQALASQN